MDDNQLSPGCLYHATDDCCIQTYDYMINKSQKEVMFDLYNKLSKIDIQKSPSPKKLLKVTPQSVEKIITASKGYLHFVNFSSVTKAFTNITFYQTSDRAWLCTEVHFISLFLVTVSKISWYLRPSGLGD